MNRPRESIILAIAWSHLSPLSLPPFIRILYAVLATALVFLPVSAVYPVQFDYSVFPLEYPLRSVRADVLVDDVVTLQFGSSSRLNQSKILIERGYPFDIAKRNQVQLTSSPFEIKSEIVNLPFRQPLITAVRFDSGPGGESTGQPSADAGGGSGSGPSSSNIASGIGDKFRLTTDVDLTNGRMCRIGATYVFTLAQAATITLTAQPVGDDGQPAGTEEKLIDNRDYEKGDNNYQLDPAKFLPRKNGYLLTLKAVSKADTSISQTSISEMLVIFNTHDALPVGQVLVKGVNVKSGRLVLPGQSIQANGRGPALAFRPTYSSAGNGRLGSLGANWSHNYEAGLSITQCGDVIVSAGDSGTIRFHPGPNGTLVPTKGYHGTLIANTTDQSFDFYSKDGTHYHFIFVPPAKRWFLSSIADTNGNTLKLVYNMASAEGQLLTVTDAGGRKLVFTYQSFSLKQRGLAALITKVLGPEGMGLEFAYDDFGNLIESTRIDAPDASETYAYSVEAGLRFANLLTGHSNANGQVTSYAYNIGTADYFLSSGSAAAANITLPDSKVTSVTAADGGKTSFSYVPGVQGTSTPVTTVTDARSNDSTYTLNRYGSPLTIRTPAGTTTTEWETGDIVMKSRTDANGVKTSYTHDAHGNVLTENVVGDGVNVTSSNTWLVQTAPPYIKNRPLTHTDRRGATTSYIYDTAGNLTAENRPEGVNLSYTYAANGDKLSATDGRNGLTKFAYDGNGNLERVTDPLGGVATTKHDSRGRLTSIIDQEGRVTEMQYDALDHLVQHVDAAGGKRISTFDVLGNKLSEIDEAGRLTRYEYDAVNRPTKITNPVASKTIGYDKAGNKVSESDWVGNITTYAYDGANRLTTRTEPQSKTTRYSYDGVGNIKTETDALNRVTSHDYDGLNRRIKTTDADNGVSTMKYDGNGNKTEATDAESRLAKYEFDNLNRLTKATADSTGIAAVTAYRYDGNGNVLAVTDANGKITQHEYDANNRKTKTIDALGSITSVVYDKVGNKLQEFNARNFARNWTYDLLNRVTLARDEALQQTSYEYDKVGNRTSETLPNGNRLVHTFDALNRRTSSRDNLGSLSATSYDGQGNALSQTDANGNVAAHTYDSLNRKSVSQLPSAAGTRTLNFGYDLVGNLTSERDANDNTTTHIYDPLNRRTSTSDSIGTRFRATYDKVGNMVSETDANANVDTHVYDGLNRRTRTTDSLGVFTQAGYDKVGNKVSGKDANGIETRTTYDALNRPTSVTRDSVLMVTNEYDAVGNLRFATDARGNKVGYEYDPRNLMTKDNRALGVITSYTRDTMGDITETLDPEGRTSVSSYDLRRRMLSSKNGALETTTFSYDANGNRTGVLKPKGNTQAFVYDTANRLVKVTTPAGSSGLGYDKHGNLVSRKDAKNHTTGYQYDARHRRTETLFADNARETQTFDGQGNLKTLTDALGVVTTYIYDARHRETQKSYSASTDALQRIATQYDGNGNVTETKETYGTGGSATMRTHTRTYDTFNRLERETDPWGDIIRHTYDAQGNRTATTAQGATSNYGFDALNRRISVTAAGGAITTTYDRTHLATGVAYPNGVTSTTSYDAALRVKDITHAKSGTTLERTAYVYDTNGNRTLQTRTLPAGTETVNYQYDNDDWLKQTDTASSIGGSSTRTVVYTLDAVGNRAVEASTATGANAASQTYGKTFTLDSRDRVTQIVATGANAGTTAFTYDANGNLTTKESGSALRRYVWNVRDRLVEVTANGVSLAKYKYNAEGMRDEIEGRRRTTWVSGFAYLDKTIANTLLAKYETQANGRSPAVAITASGNEYLQADALGSTTLSTAGDGSVNAVTTYDAFGNTVTQGATQNKFGYTGHEQDNDTGLIYFKARHYDPELGRFISADPYEGEPNAPVSWNSYLYANSNPLYYIDRNGYWSWSEAAESAWNDAKYVAGAVAGASASIVEGAVGAAVIVGDAGAGMAGNVEALKRNAARGKAIAHAVTNPTETAGRVWNHIVSENEGAQRERAQGNHFTAGIVKGKLVTDVASTVVGGAGLVKGGVTIAKNARNAARAERAERAATIREQAIARDDPLAGPRGAAEPAPMATGGRTAPNVGDAAPAMITEGPKINPSGKPANVAGTAVAEQSKPSSGPVEFTAPEGATPAQIQQFRDYVNGCNDALCAGALSDTGRVSTKGELRRQASRDAAAERRRAAAEGNPYQQGQHAGHVPDTTWTGNPQPFKYMSLDELVNSSLGGQAGRYPLGHKPTEFLFKEPMKK